MRFATEVWARLLEKGCLCGGVDPASCPVHPEPSDNRGLAAYFKAGMPKGFPLVAHCSLCGDEGLLYPDVEIDDPKRSGEFRPTLICPRHSDGGGERVLRTDAEQFGYDLNARSVFGLAAAA